MGKKDVIEMPGAKGLFLLLMLFFVTVPPARADDWDRIRKEAGDIQTINAQFIQEKHLEILIKPLISKGAFYFRAPGSLRWEYFSPIKSILVMHDGAVRRFIGTETGFKEDASPGLQAMEMVLREISFWLKGKFSDNPNYGATLEGHNKIVMVPRDQAFKKIIQKIEILLSDRPGVIDTVTIYEGKTSFTKIRFQNVKINEGVA
ncbi:MAG: outer membrane lipoprotein carrier protein LolA, partial [Deltaproteobacteria bacterium]|nr:outer membrane lipoprotein carrier protein LolA [Deltaproteobacteria bacterium]